MNQDLSKLKFPLFETTEQEKELLRKAELRLTDHRHWHSTLCATLSKLPRDPKLSRSCSQWEWLVDELKRKISISLGRSVYLEGALFGNNETDGYCRLHGNAKLPRRYWITLLLNYKPTKADARYCDES